MKSCFDYALNHCSRFPKSERNLKQFLIKKGYEQEEVEETINRLKKMNFVNDSVYVELYIESEVCRKGRPLFLIQQKLYAKGIDRELFFSIAATLENEINAGMKKQIIKEYERFLSRDIPFENIIKKLIQKGYPYEFVRKILSTQ